ncbi:MAG: hypothetical protein ACYTKD_15915 [Planctomycetota bacterium]
MVRELEAKLQGLLAEVAKAADYEGVLFVTSLAQSVGKLAAEVERGETPGAAPRNVRSHHSKSHSAPPVPPAVAQPQVKSPGSSRTLRKKRSRRRKRRAKREAPRFFWRGGHLVKVAHSKKSGNYSHRTPEKGLWSVVHAVSKLGAGNGLFTAEAVMEAVGIDGGEVPSYQAYLVLSWLKHEALIEPEGRQGYRVVANDSLERAARKKLAALPG